MVNDKDFWCSHCFLHHLCGVYGIKCPRQENVITWFMWSELSVQLIVNHTQSHVRSVLRQYWTESTRGNVFLGAAITSYLLNKSFKFSHAITDCIIKSYKRWISSYLMVDNDLFMQCLSIGLRVGDIPTNWI